MRITQRNLGCGLLYAFSILFIGLLSGCGSGTALPPEKNALVSIEITPSALTIPMGINEKFTATGIYKDSSKRDITSSVKWESSDMNVVSISNASDIQGSATTLDTGTVTISAMDSATNVKGETTLTVTPAVLTELSITPTNPTIAMNMTEQFTATGTFSDLTTQDMTASVDWSSADEAIATVGNDGTSKGLATGMTAGSVTITATDSTGAISADTTLNITDANLVSIEITPPDPSLALGTTEQLTATGTFSDSTTHDITASVSWDSNDTTVATISNDSAGKGLAQSVDQGSTTITATDAASGISANITLTVTKAALVSIEIAPANSIIGVGTTQLFSAIGTYTDASTQDITNSVTWSSSDDTIASISNAAGDEGKATGRAAGSVSIKATDPETEIRSSTALTVTGATLTSIEIAPANQSIALGTNQQFTATGTYSDDSTQDITASVTWSSSDSAVATISNDSASKGLADSVATGTVTITVTDPVSGVSSDTTLTVTAATLTSIEITPVNPSIALGTTQQFIATGIYSDNSSQDITALVTWGSSDKAVATISNDSASKGLADTVAAGTVTITATDPASGVSSEATLTVTAATLISIEIKPADPSIALGTTQQFTAIGTYSDASTQDISASVTWSSDDPAVAIISNDSSSKGLAQSIAQGSATITATDPESKVSSDATLTVTAATLTSIEITPADPSIALGTTQQFTAIGTYSDASTQDVTALVTWSSSDNAVATISNDSASKGLANAVASGTVTITATDPASGVSSDSTLTVTAATLTSIEITPASASIVIGASQQFTATGTYSDTSTQDLTATVTWHSSNNFVATVSNATGSQGLATGVRNGVATISAVDPTTNISAEATLTVFGMMPR